MYVILFAGRQKVSDNISNERPTTLRRPRNQKEIKCTVIQIKNNCYLIAVGLYSETFAFQLFIFCIYSS